MGAARSGATDSSAFRADEMKEAETATFVRMVISVQAPIPSAGGK
jgi:hypothetical protein